MKQTPKGACDRGACFMDRSVGLGRRRRAASGAFRCIANGEGASFGRGRAGYGALANGTKSLGLGRSLRWLALAETGEWDTERLR